MKKETKQHKKKEEVVLLTDDVRGFFSRSFLFSFTCYRRKRERCGEQEKRGRERMDVYAHLSVSVCVSLCLFLSQGLVLRLFYVLRFVSFQVWSKSEDFWISSTLSNFSLSPSLSLFVF